VSGVSPLDRLSLPTTPAFGPENRRQRHSELWHNAIHVTDRLALPLVLLQNWLPSLEGVYVHAQAPTTKPISPGPYRALIDTGASHSWVKSHIGDSLQSHSLEGYVVDRGDGTEEEAGVDVKVGFMKRLSGRPVRGWAQLDARLPAIEMLLLSGDFGAPADVLIGMDLLCNFVQCGVLIRGVARQPQLVLEF
jgi:hypothetical protein